MYMCKYVHVYMCTCIHVHIVFLKVVCHFSVALFIFSCVFVALSISKNFSLFFSARLVLLFFLGLRFPFYTYDSFNFFIQGQKKFFSFHLNFDCIKCRFGRATVGRHIIRGFIPSLDARLNRL
jgi:hypothetical protein